MEKTLKQIAEELGISKQRVKRFVKNNGIEPVRVEGQTGLYSDPVQKRIKTAFSNDPEKGEPVREPVREPDCEPDCEPVRDPVTETYIKHLEAEIKRLEAEKTELYGIIKNQQELNRLQLVKYGALETAADPEPKEIITPVSDPVEPVRDPVREPVNDPLKPVKKSMEKTQKEAKKHAKTKENTKKTKKKQNVFDNIRKLFR